MQMSSINARAVAVLHVKVAFMCVPWLIHVWDMTHCWMVFLSNNAFMCVWDMSRMTHSYVCHDSFMCNHCGPPCRHCHPRRALWQRRTCTRCTARSLHEGRPCVCCLNSRPIDKYTYRWIETYTHIHKLQKSRTQIYIWAHRASSKATRLFLTK